MLLQIANLLFINIFFKQITVADSYWGQLTDLGRSQIRDNSTSYEFSNCSTYTIAPGSSCTCFDCNEQQCTICCNSPGFTCCYCPVCSTTCWKNDWHVVSLAQIGMSTAILVATVASIALFFRICHGGFSLVRRGGNRNNLTRNIPSRVSVSSVQQYIIERLQDRPPQYNNASDAPPVYDADPSNSVATLEDPPKYTRKPQDTEKTNNSSQPRSESSSSSTRTETVTETTVTPVVLSMTSNHM